MQCQQDELYAAEAAAHFPPSSREQLTRRQAEALVNSWRELPWWEENFPNVAYIEVKEHNRDDGSAGRFHPKANAGVIDMMHDHLKPWVLVHEVSHVLAQARYGSHAHDPWFVRTYLQLGYLALGTDFYQALYGALIAAEIDHEIDE